jgi:Fe-S-cluster containining protein
VQFGGAYAKAKRSCSFLKKRTKKLLPLGARCRIEPRQPNKSLLLLFFRKEDLS